MAQVLVFLQPACNSQWGYKFKSFVLPHLRMLQVFKEWARRYCEYIYVARIYIGRKQYAIYNILKFCISELVQWPSTLILCPVLPASHTHMGYTCSYSSHSPLLIQLSVYEQIRQDKMAQVLGLQDPWKRYRRGPWFPNLDQLSCGHCHHLRSETGDARSPLFLLFFL